MSVKTFKYQEFVAFLTLGKTRLSPQSDKRNAESNEIRKREKKKKSVTNVE